MHRHRAASRIRHGALRAPLILCLAAAAGCPAAETGPPSPERCNPLSSDRCLLPWPSSFYLVQDSATATGYSVQYPEKALPRNRDGVPLDPTRYNKLDGFSPGSQILVTFASGVSPKGLPSLDKLAESQSDSSLIWVLKYGSTERVPLFAELDANAKGKQVPALIIRPQVPLEPNARYVVALRAGLEDAQGLPLEPADGFRRLRDSGSTGDSTLETLREPTEEVLAFLEKQHHVAREDLLLAWDFRTASEEALTGPLLSIVDNALDRLPAQGPAVKTTESKEIDSAADPYVMRRITVEMQIPSYLESDAPDARLHFGADRRPSYRGLQRFPLWISVPRCAETATAPLPFIIVAHGIFGAGKNELDGGFYRQLQDRHCAINVSMDWHGLSLVDIPDVTEDVVSDFSNFPRISDRLHQAHVNNHVLARAMRTSLPKLAELQLEGSPLTDGKEIYFVGISGGEIQGLTFAALNPDIERYVLNVGGGWWSQMIPRSGSFALLAVMMDSVYPDPVDRLILISLTQHLWDSTDPISFAQHLLRKPFPGRAPRHILLQEARDDEKVPNLATRAVGRAAGLPLLSPSVVPVYGLEAKAGPLAASITQWDIQTPYKPPAGNIPASTPPFEFSPHDKVRTLTACQKQIDAFLANGTIVSTCDGACDPE